MIVNLIPAPRRHRQRYRRRFRTWIAVCSAYAVLVLAAVAAGHLLAPDTAPVEEALQSAETRRATAGATFAALRHKLEGVVDSLHANLAVGDQPDWSVPLALVAKCTEDEVVLRHFSTWRSDHRGGAGRTADDPDENASSQARIRAELRGLGRSQQAVSRFLLRIEKLPLFREVKLHDTAREPFLDGYGVAFRLECVLETGEEVSP